MTINTFIVFRFDESGGRRGLAPKKLIHFNKILKCSLLSYGIIRLFANEGFRLEGELVGIKK